MAKATNELLTGAVVVGGVLLAFNLFKKGKATIGDAVSEVSKEVIKETLTERFIDKVSEVRTVLNEKTETVISKAGLTAPDQRAEQAVRQIPGAEVVDPQFGDPKTTIFVRNDDTLFKFEEDDVTRFESGQLSRGVPVQAISDFSNLRVDTLKTIGKVAFNTSLIGIVTAFPRFIFKRLFRG